MQQYYFFKKKYPFPDKKEMLQILACVLLPNIIFLIVALYASISRPIINIDYLIALFFLLIPWWGSRILGITLLVIAMLFDGLMLVIQVFPFMDLAAIRYLLPFVSIAPTNYLVAIAGFILCTCSILGLSLYFTRLQK